MKSFLLLSVLTITISASNVGAKTESHGATDSHAKPSASPAHQSSGSVDPEKALTYLKNGNIRFTKQRLRNDGTK
jgi:hypothetical protein